MCSSSMEGSMAQMERVGATARKKGFVSLLNLHELGQLPREKELSASPSASLIHA